MTTQKTGLRLDFMPLEPTTQDPFILQTGQDQGSMPVQIRPMAVHAWTRDPDEYLKDLQYALIMEAPGRQRVRLYCSKALAAATRISVHGGTSKHLGRRTEPLLETLTWTQTNTKRLKYHYNQPSIQVVDHTRFFTNTGQETQLPDYNQETGEFHHPQEVTGALVVEYSPEYSLYEIEYDTGSSQIPAQWFREMQLAWLAGDIHNSTIPLVRVIALGPKQATQITFSRNFWPSRSNVRIGFKSMAIPQIEQVGVSFQMKPDITDPCWLRCKNLIKPDSPYLNDDEVIAIRKCVEAEKSPKFHYVEESRSVKIERIFAADNADYYIDVARPVELVMKLQRADAAVCEHQAPSGCCPELRLRFASSE